jgi:hypothetical protein
LEIWSRSGNLEIWQFGNLAIWKSEDLESGDLEIWRFLKIWRFENWRLENLET